MSDANGDGRKLNRTVRVKNVTDVLQGVGFAEFEPGEVKDVVEHIALNLVALPYFEIDEYGANKAIAAPHPKTPPALVPFAAEVARMIEPDPPTPDWIASVNAKTFPCQTREFDAVQAGSRSLNIVVRMRDLAELNGGSRVVLRICGYLKHRGHQVTLSVANNQLPAGEISGVRVVHGIPDADVLVGTYWTTINEIVADSAAGVRVGFLQSNEPSWMKHGEPLLGAAIAAVSHTDVHYLAISRQVAQSCNRDYGTLCPSWIRGNGVDCLDFSPRINNFDRRNRACAIYRGIWFKGDTFILNVMAKLKECVAGMTTAMAGFRRFDSPVLDRYLCDPPVSEMALFYSRSDVYLSGSRIEGSPLPPLEAMACGCIPVVTEIGTEEYLVDGENGFLIESDDIKGAVKAVTRLYKDDALRQRMINSALATARGRTWESVGQQFEEIIMGIMGGSKEAE